MSAVFVRSLGSSCSVLAIAIVLSACGDSGPPAGGQNQGLEVALAELRVSRDQLLEVLEDTVELAELESAARIASGDDGLARPMSVLPVVAAPPQPAAWPAGISLTPAISDVEYPVACTDGEASTPCEQDSNLELAMERKFWAIV